MDINQLEKRSNEEKIIHIIVEIDFHSVEMDVFPGNTINQILTECASDLNLKISSRSSHIAAKNMRTGIASMDLNSTAKELNLNNGDTLLIYNSSAPDATTVQHFSIVNNTLFRTQKNAPKARENYHELLIASSNDSSGYGIKFYIQDSCLYDIISPFCWMPKAFDEKNYLTNGKRVTMIVNEQSGKCAMPSEFDTLISDFIGNEEKPVRLYVILENENIGGMHLERFYFEK